MWLFSKTGFVSITDNPDRPGTFLVRARTRDDLESFVLSGPVYARPVIDTIVDSGDERDYRWRVVLGRSVVHEIIARQLDDLDYTNVKASIDKGDPKRHTALMGVWDSMMTLQEGGLYNTLSRRHWADDDDDDECPFDCDYCHADGRGPNP